MAYTTSQLDAIIATLESALGSGTADVTFQGRRLVYRSVTDIRNAIAYFQALYNNVSAAPVTTVQKIRTFLFHGGKGFGF